MLPKVTAVRFDRVLVQGGPNCASFSLKRKTMRRLS
jgi:hypothetical protein